MNRNVEQSYGDSDVARFAQAHGLDVIQLTFDRNENDDWSSATAYLSCTVVQWLSKKLGEVEFYLFARSEGEIRSSSVSHQKGFWLSNKELRTMPKNRRETIVERTFENDGRTLFVSVSKISSDAVAFVANWIRRSQCGLLVAVPDHGLGSVNGGSEFLQNINPESFDRMQLGEFIVELCNRHLACIRFFGSFDDNVCCAEVFLTRRNRPKRLHG